MGYLTTFRGLFGNVLEVFDTGKGLQPKDLLHALQNTIEDRKKILLDGVFVPNHFTVHLSRKDMAEIQPLLRSLIDQLTVKVGEWIAQKGYATLSGTIRVDVKESPELAEDEVYIEAVMQERPAGVGRPEPAGPAVSAAVPVPVTPGRGESTPTRPEPGPVRPPVAPARPGNGHAGLDGTPPEGTRSDHTRPDLTRPESDRKTMILADRRTIVMDRPVGQLRIVTGKDAGRGFTLKPGDTTIGRGPEAQIVLQEDPPFVSRLHCTVRALPGEIEVTDLDSTNGVLVSGKRVTHAVLRHLDTMQLGSFTLQFVGALEGSGAGGAVVVWPDHRVSHGNPDVFGQRLDSAAGEPRWLVDGALIATARSLFGEETSQGNPRSASDGEGGAIVAWEDTRTGQSDIFAQRVGPDGLARWPANGVPVSTACWTGGLCANAKRDVQIVSEMAGGAIVVWGEMRDGFHLSVWAQRVSAAGQPLWTVNGVPVVSGAFNADFPKVASDGAGGAIVAWQDDRSDTDTRIRSQRVAPDGRLLWAASAVEVSPRIGHRGVQGHAVLAHDERLPARDRDLREGVGHSVLRALHLVGRGHAAAQPDCGITRGGGGARGCLPATCRRPRA